MTFLPGSADRDTPGRNYAGVGAFFSPGSLMASITSRSTPSVRAARILMQGESVFRACWSRLRNRASRGGTKAGFIAMNQALKSRAESGANP